MTPRPGEGVKQPVPDEAPFVERQQLTPQPEPDELGLNPRLRDFSFADCRGILVRAGRRLLDDNGTLLASALAYSTFFAIPSVALVVVGLFTLVASPHTITTLIDHFSSVMPEQATTLLEDSLQNLNRHPGSGVAMIAVGSTLALWSTTGAMNAYMTALNVVYERDDRRSFVRKRLVALGMVAAIGLAFLLVAGLLIFGAHVERLVGDAVGAPGLIRWLWWVVQWPILVLGLLAAFATLLYLGPDVGGPRWEFLTLGSLVAVSVWLAASGGFAVYAAKFGSYNKTWGSLSAVIVTLIWLWLGAMALLLGAAVNAEARRSREQRSAVSSRAGASP
jgi:membrane protein